MKVKKTLAIVFTSLLILGLSIGILASSPEMPECEVTGGSHEYVDAGNYVYCAACGEVLSHIECPPHDWYEENGRLVCGLCGAVWYRPI